MRRIKKADDAYNRISNSIFFYMILIAVIANAYFGGLENYLAGFIFILAIFNGAIIASEYVKTKRIRLLASLPVPIKTLSLYRYYGLVTGWSLLMALLFLSSLISRRGDLGLDYLWWLLSRTGIMFVMVGCLSLTTSLFYYLKDTGVNKALMRWVVGPILLIECMFCGSLYFISISESVEISSDFFSKISEVILTFSGSTGLVVLGLLLLGLDVYVFARRRSYTDEVGWPY